MQIKKIRIAIQRSDYLNNLPSLLFRVNDNVSFVLLLSGRGSIAKHATRKLKTRL